MDASTIDWRLIGEGIKLPASGYLDQPYLLIAPDGAWLCCVTTCKGMEGDKGQHVLTMRSLDQGKTWTDLVQVEPPDGPESSYATMLKTPSGRIYVFYNHNSDNVREVLRHDKSEAFSRVDSLGHFVFKFSDDSGRSWSKLRYDIPFRRLACDFQNVYGGELCFFWNVGKPFSLGSDAFVPLIRVGKMGDGFFAKSEGSLLKSPNILTESDPSRIVWETLPDGDTGLRAPQGGGPISEEQSCVPLSDGSLYCVYRTIDGFPVSALSRDGGRTWKEQYMRFADGRQVKHPRAANFVWKCANGKYLYWFHNHGGRFIGESPDRVHGLAYDDRNPAWLCPGVEADTPEGRTILWGEPEIAIYDDDPFIRISYPDLLEDSGSYFITETQKDTARLHKIPADFIEAAWRSLELSSGLVKSAKPAPLADALLLDLREIPANVEAPKLPYFYFRDHKASDGHGVRSRASFAIEIAVAPSGHDETLIDAMPELDRGLRVRALASGSLELVLADAWSQCLYVTEPFLKPGAITRLVLNVDGGPNIASVVADGKFLDGGSSRQFGWGRFSPFLKQVSYAKDWKLSKSLSLLRVFGRSLRTSEAILENLAFK